MKGKRVSLTDKQVEKEIECLSGSEAVALARQEKRVKYKRRQYLYQLRWLEKRGKELQEQGVTKVLQMMRFLCIPADRIMLIHISFRYAFVFSPFSVIIELVFYLSARSLPAYTGALF